MSELWIDVSVHNGTIDWNKVKAVGVKGAVIRAGYGSDISQVDKAFVDNITGAIKAGLQVGVYWFHYADSISEMQKEWKVCRQIIAPYKNYIRFVASDYEYDSVRYYKQMHNGIAPSNSLINQLVNNFLQAVEYNGYAAWLYSNNDYRKNIFTADTWNRWPKWLADYTGDPDVPCNMQQTCSNGTVAGITGSVDMNTLFVPFSNPSGTPDLDYTCDTSAVVKIKRGNAYQAKITCDQIPKVVLGTPDVAVTLYRRSDGNTHYFYFVPIGQSGQEVGVYINNGPRQFIIRIE